ncbi:hypothetical protein LBMAG42_14420 [Deltaproteobacteria bacterium]|nr:hypothetical protein LBMAG42_14420 [Deltaproteobacteria bacterium]
MGLRDRLRLLVRPAAPADAPVPRRSVARAPEPVGPPPVSIPTRVEQLTPGVPVVDVEVLPAAPFAALCGPLIVTSKGDKGARASVAAERMSAFGIPRVSWLAAEPA